VAAFGTPTFELAGIDGAKTAADAGAIAADWDATPKVAGAAAVAAAVVAFGGDALFPDTGAAAPAFPPPVSQDIPRVWQVSQGAVVVG